MHVCVIGAGAGGLCALRHLSGLRLSAVAYELSPFVGGTWVYSEKTGLDKHGLPIQSSMYRSLKTNLPKEVMAFPDFPFSKQVEPGDRSFLTHEQVRLYLEQYCDHFKLRDKIRFETLVQKVQPLKLPSSDSCQWKVTVQDLPSQAVSEHIYDAVMVCSGHYSVPYTPSISQLDQFQGLQMHSHDYRQPEPFRDMSVVVFGAASSGTDICLEVAKVARQVYLSHNNPLLASKLPSNLAQVRGLSSCLGKNAFLLTDGSKLQADAIIFCTGYEYSFPFLSDDCHTQVSQRLMAPLYKHLVHTEFPSLAFVGIPTAIAPFPLFDRQAQFFSRILTGQVSLPPRSTMEADIEAERERRHNKLGMPERHFHKMSDLQWAYNQELAELAGIEPLPPVIQRLYEFVHGRRRKELTEYKKDAFRRQDDKHFEQLK